jgi:hypothetical protein
MAGADPKNRAIFDHLDLATRRAATRPNEPRAQANSARHAAKSRSRIEPEVGRGKAWNGRAGQAFVVVESGVVDGATANSPPQTAAGHKQDDQAAKTKPPAGNYWRILDQSLEPTRVRSSRNRPLE